MGPTRRTASARPHAPRGLWAQVRLLLLQPGAFFRAYPHGQSWLAVALLLMLLSGFSELQRDKRLPSGTGADAAALPSPAEAVVDPGLLPPGEAFPGDFGTSPLPPGDPGAPLPDAAGSAGDLTADLGAVLVAGSRLPVLWGLTALLLWLAALLWRVKFRAGDALRLAVWVSVPLGLMAALQLAFYAAGGRAGLPGLTGFLDEWPAYATLPPLLQSGLLSAAGRGTLFDAWCAVLLLLAARRAVRVPGVLAGGVLLLWLAGLILLPIATGAVPVVYPERELPPLLTLPPA
ncbi:MAG: hypothetical protein MUE40_20740, partial [Anaerolineae bacterium]|nr:hypothetical protein [Anaerolineae bacterium]